MAQEQYCEDYQETLCTIKLRSSRFTGVTTEAHYFVVLLNACVEASDAPINWSNIRLFD